MTERDTFGSRLRRQREQRGIALDAIADTTKIKASLLAALERNDLTHWPAGIFGRGFLRAYANAIGLPPEPVVAEFQELLRPVPEPGTSRLRLTLEPEARWTGPALFRRLIIAALDAMVVLLWGSAIARVAGLDVWLSCLLVGAAYYSMGTICFSRSMASRVLEPSGPPVAILAVPESDATDQGLPAPGWLRIV